MPGPLDFSAEPSFTWLDANHPMRFARRAQVGIHNFAEQVVSIYKIPNYPDSGVTGEDFVNQAIARLEVGGKGPIQTTYFHYDPSDRPLNWWAFSHNEVTEVENIPFVNDWLARTRVNGAVGTNFEINIPVLPDPFSSVVASVVNSFSRKGDWDIVQKGLIVILYRHSRKLRPEVYNHVLHNLLNQRGPHSFEIMTPRPLPVLETENHVIMIESSRYLTNQLLYLEGWQNGQHLAEFDNNENGLTAWLLGLMQWYLQHDFWEFNAKPYQRYTTTALQNLYDYAWDDEICLAARCVLDFISAKTAVSSNGLRRSVPFRRLYQFLNDPYLLSGAVDAQTSRMILLSGYIERLADISPPDKRFADTGSNDQLLLAGICSYRVPELILELLMNKDRTPYYQRFFHGNRRHYGVLVSDLQDDIMVPQAIPGGVEIYASQPEFLISAGGAYFPNGNVFNNVKDSAHAVPTTLMPTKGGANRNEFIRILGALGEDNDKGRVNTTVLPGFASGFNVAIPPLYKPPPGEIGEVIGVDNLYEKIGNWTFINAAYDSPNPAIQFGFHVAVHTIDMVGPGGVYTGWNYGFFEVVPSRLRTFDQFKALVLQNNGARDFGRLDSIYEEYVATDGRVIKFQWGLYPYNSGDYIVHFLVAQTSLQWGIQSVNGEPVESNIGKWPLAIGDIINSRQIPNDENDIGHSGWLSIDNPYFQTRLVLDMRNPLIPRRYQHRKNASRQAASALSTRDVFRLDYFWDDPNGALHRISWDAYVNNGSWGFPTLMSPRTAVQRASPITAINRTAESTDVFWFKGDGSIWSCWWNASVNSGEWHQPYAVPLGGGKGATRNSGFAAVSRTPDHIDIFWIAKDGSVWTHWWSTLEPNAFWEHHSAFEISGPGSAAVNSKIVAISRFHDRIDVFWIDPLGAVATAEWDPRNGWRARQITGTQVAAPDTSLSTNARHPEHMDVFWVAQDGAIYGTWRSDVVDGANWHPVYPLAPAGSAALNSGLASVARVDGHVDVFWTTSQGGIFTTFFSDFAERKEWVPSFRAVADGLVRSGSRINAVAREPHHLDLVWVGPDREVMTQWWDQHGVQGSWDQHGAYAITEPKVVREAIGGLNPVG